jgi:hypothetical protein
MTVTDPSTATTGRRDRRREDGYALVTVIGAMAALTLVAAAALAAAVGGLPQSKRAQTSAAALAAAQAGVTDLVTQANICRDYWVNPSACASVGLPAPAADGWSAVQGSAPEDNARYRVEYLVTPEALPDGSTSVQPGLIRVQVTGEVRGLQRRVTVDLRQPGFLQYIYYTDVEAHDPLVLAHRFPERRYDRYVLPAKKSDGSTVYVEFTDVSFSGVGPAAAQACNRYWYAPDGSTGTRTAPVETFRGMYGDTPVQQDLSRPCDLKFNGTDVVRGPLHTNDAIVLEEGATFTSPTTHTSWRNPSGTDPPPAQDDTTVDWFRPHPDGSAAQPGTAGHRPRYAPPVTMPWQSSETATAAGRGCIYTGPTSVELLPTGRLRVYSPYSRDLTADCGGTAVTTAPQEVPGPGNGVIHVQNRARDLFWASEPCPAQVLEKYPMVDSTGRTDITRYPCTDGDAFVEGSAGRPLTVSAENEVVITDDITVDGGLTGRNVVGLVAQGQVEVYHPVACLDAVTAPKVCPDTRYENLSTATDNLVVQAAIISMAHSFTVQNYDKAPELGTITVAGGIYQRFRGPVSTLLDHAPAGATVPDLRPTGYPSKLYDYDRRLLDVPPPAFPVPVGSSWSVAHFAEQQA